MSRLTEIRDEWNNLVPAARAAGVNVRPWSMTPTTADYGACRVEWLRGRIAAANGTAAPRPLPPLAVVMPAAPVDEPLPDLTFGVEFEFILPLAHGIASMTRADLAVKLRDAGVDCFAEMYHHHVRPHWKIITDSTVGSNGAELVSPILRGTDGIAVMRRACEVLVANGCSINRACGFHVHVGAGGNRPNFFRNIVRMYSHYERALDDVMAPSRRGSSNSYCGPVGDVRHLDSLRTTRSVISRYRRGNRYSKVNLAAYLRHGTVEYRHHGGTIEADKADNWVRLCLRMAMAAKTGAVLMLPADASLDSLLALVRATAAERRYFEGRADHFARREGRLPAHSAPTTAVVAAPAIPVPDNAANTPTGLTSNVVGRIADSAVTTARIADSAVTTAHIAPTTLPFASWMRATHPDVVFYDTRRNPNG